MFVDVTYGMLQVSLVTVRDNVGPSLKYVEFVLSPTSVFDIFVVAADKVLEPILPGACGEGGAGCRGGRGGVDARHKPLPLRYRQAGVGGSVQ
jgi:hypothetical protein